jgi:uncharacterized protein YbjT (DUF2867 family)
MSTILVTGATGPVGRHVVEQLLDAGATVRATTRDPETAKLPAGVEVVAGDYTSGQLHDGAFPNVTGVFVFPAVGGIDAFLTRAAAAGVPHLVVLSSLAAAEEHPRDIGSASNLHHRFIEHAVSRCGVPATILRPGAFATNLLAWAPAIRAGDTVYGPYAASAQAPIHEADVAAVAVAALLDPNRHRGKTYPITGPQSLTRVQQLDAIGAAIGRHLHFHEISAEAFQESTGHYIPPDIMKMLLDYWSDTVTQPDDVRSTEQITGQPARTVAQWATDHADDFR